MHRLLADFLVGDRVFEIGLESRVPSRLASGSGVGHRAPVNLLMPRDGIQPHPIA